jgi:hypothetical protein
LQKQTAPAKKDRRFDKVRRLPTASTLPIISGDFGTSRWQLAD